jgi:outer membrane protein
MNNRDVALLMSEHESLFPEIQRMKSRNALVFVLALVLFVLWGERSYAELITLSQGLKLAEENNRLIRIARQDESISKQDTLIARAKMLPDVNAAIDQTFLAHTPNALFGPLVVPMSQKDFLSYTVNIQQTLYDFRKNAAHYEASKAILNTKRLDEKRISNMVALDFGLSYFDLLETEKMILVAEREAERLESHLRDAQNLYEEGVITKNDLLQAEVRISDAKQRLLTARNLRAVTASQLNNVLVRPLNTKVEVTDNYIKELKGLSTDLLDLDVEKAWEIAERLRPEIMIADETTRSLELERTSKKADYYPKFYVRGSYDYLENRYAAPNANWSLTVGLGINLFSGGSTKAEVQKLEYQKLKLLEEKNNLIDGIKLELQKSLLDSRSAREKIAVTKDAVQQAEENLRINRSRYEDGVGTATDVLDAVTLLTVAETNYYRSIYDLSRAEAAVLYSMGIELSEVYK